MQQKNRNAKAYREAKKEQAQQHPLTRLGNRFIGAKADFETDATYDQGSDDRNDQFAQDN